MNVGFRIPTRADAVERVERGLDLRKYLNFAWRHWKFIGAVAGLALLIGLIYVARATPLYTATTQVLLELQSQKAPGAEGPASEGSIDDVPLMENQLAILRSDSLLRRVVDKERLAPPPASGGDAKAVDAQVIQNGIDRVRGALRVGRSGQAHVLNISITWDDPGKAARLANT